MKHSIHYVESLKSDAFVWGVGTTNCGKKHYQIIEFTSDIDSVTCKKCKQMNLL